MKIIIILFCKIFCNKKMINLHLLYKKEYMAVLTKKSQRKHERNLAIVAEFKIMIKVKGSQKVAIYEHLAACHDVSVSTIGRIVSRYA